MASDEVDSHLGKRYVVPLNFSDDQADGYIAPHSQLAVQRIANFLASGRLILAQAVGGEDNRLQRYGEYLVMQALEELVGLIVDGAVEQVEADARGPGIAQEDTDSPIAAYYANFGRGGPFGDVWSPYA